MQRVQRGQIRVDATHEAFEKDNLGQAETQPFEIARELVELAEIVQLHRTGEVQRQVFQIGTTNGQFAKNFDGDQFNGQVDVDKGGVESRADRVKKGVEPAYVNGADASVIAVRTKIETTPQVRMMRDERVPTATDACASN